MQRKKLDSRIPTLIANGVQNNHRSFFVMIGDRGKDQVVTLHYLLSKARISVRPSVLWCYKRELGFTSHRQKRMKQIKKQIARGVRDADEDDPFELFISSTNIRYTYYKETENILGNTYGMCILQDFEAITPNILARTIETVEGGGVVVLLLKTMKSLKQLYTMTMDVHSRYRTESHYDTVARFNERFILSLGSCENCLVIDDELNILPLSLGKNVKPLVKNQENELSKEEKELKDLKDSLADTQPVGSLVSCAKTIDQGKALLTFVEAIAEKTLRSTVTLTAARGRGKSASLGIAIAAAIAYGYSNIFITSPSPENLKTLFEFVFKGFDALGYEEHLDYDIVQSTNPAFQKAIVRVNVFKDHRQTIQYIQPADHQMLAQAELLVIDEAAAIPLPTVKKLLGPYLVFMASTINGYEGTGRSLSIKLFQQLREQSKGAAASNSSLSNPKEKSGAYTNTNVALVGRTLREVQLSTPIRYGPSDPVESWLNKLLCLDCCTPTTSGSSGSSIPSSLSLSMATGCPHPSKCDLYYINRDALFSYHPVSESFLQKMMSLYVASHYKNSPNDLQLMSDAPAHHLFVLLPPVSEMKGVPEPLVVLQVCLEGAIAKKSALASLSRGIRQSGDLIPWVMTQQFQDDDFASLSGARIVRVATHPDFVGMGYGRRALELLEDYYRGKFMTLSENIPVVNEGNMPRVSDDEIESSILHQETIQVRDVSKMPPLLLKLSERPLKPSERLHWLGVSYGLTQQLHKFWKRLSFVPMYIRQTSNDITGEHTCIMLKSLNQELDVQSDLTVPEDTVVAVGQSTWIAEFAFDFKKRFLELLGYQFRSFPSLNVLSIIESAEKLREQLEKKQLHENDRNSFALIDSRQKLNTIFSSFDIKRLNSYTNNLLDYHVIQDLVPTLAKLYFSGQLKSFNSSSQTFESVHLSPVQSAIMCGVGLQKKYVEEMEHELGIPVSQILALFAKSIKKCAVYFEALIEKSVSQQVDEERQLDSLTEVKDDEDENAKEGSCLERSFEIVEVKRDLLDDEAWDPTQKTLAEDLEQGQREAMEKLKEKQKQMINELDLKRYEIQGKEEDWSKVKLNQGSNIVNIKSKNSSKKRKSEVKAEDLAANLRGDKTGVYDPKGLTSKKKSKKSGKL